MSFDLTFEELPDAPALTFARVPWDSELLGLDVVEFRLREAEPSAVEAAVIRWLDGRASAGPAFVYLRTDIADLSLSERLARRGFYPAELTYEVSIPLHRLAEVAPGWKPRATVRRAGPEDLPTLQSIAGSAFQADRYHLDHHLSAARADARYDSWIANGAAAGDPIFVYEEAGGAGVLGFVHWRSRGKTADLSLAAVQPRFRGTGVGASMYEAVLRECRTLGHDRAVTRISSANLDVVNLFSRLGFSFRSARLTWHLFFDYQGEKR